MSEPETDPAPFEQWLEDRIMVLAGAIYSRIDADGILVSSEETDRWTMELATHCPMHVKMTGSGGIYIRMGERFPVRYPRLKAWRGSPCPEFMNIKVLR